jgi:hypothetical protein
MTIFMRSMSAVLGLGLVVSACSSDGPATVYIALSYQVRCLDCQPRTADDSPHPIKNVDGEIGLSLDCEVRRLADARRVTFSANHQSSDNTQNYAIRVTNGSLDGDESDGPCDVQIIEGANTYEGACGSDEPTTDRPCQATFEVKDGVVRGGVFCNKLPNMSNLTSTRYLVAPGTSTDPATFEVYGCSGL